MGRPSSESLDGANQAAMEPSFDATVGATVDAPSETDAPRTDPNVRADPARRALKARLRERLFGPRDEAPSTGDGGRIGRFVVLRALGHGAMGAVYSGYDEQLDRKVAIKVLLRDVTDTARRRVEREARSLAKLTHPNVVQVYEVGEDAGELYIAMEYVDGKTLEAWQAEPNRTWREVLAAYRQAGEGLAAAHAAGLVHRDFKPTNAMVARDGQVKVLDFGLARIEETAPSQDDSSFHSGPVSHDEKLTREGRIVGTPAYMAPEQFTNAAVDEAADQFSFCVSLWEGLYGQRPFSGASMPELFSAVVSGEMTAPPSKSNVPAWVRHAVARGFASTRSKRWPSMRELLDALDRDPFKKRRKVMMALGSVSLAAVGVFGVYSWTTAGTSRCRGADEALAEVWNDARRQQAQVAFNDIPLAYAAPAFSTAQRQMDAYARAWVEMRTDACEATRLRGEQSVAVMELRNACLDRALTAVESTADLLVAADPPLVERAHVLVSALPRLDRCTDVERLRNDRHVPPAELAPVVDAARRALTRAAVAHAAGHTEDSLAAVQDAATMLEGVEFPPVQVELGLAHGIALADAGRLDEAESVLDAALQSATTLADLESMQRIAQELLLVVGDAQRRVDDGLLSYRMLTESLVGEDPYSTPIALAAVARVLRAKGDYEEAETVLRRALELGASRLPELAVADLRGDLGAVLGGRGLLDAAELEFRRALEMRREILGPEHPVVLASEEDLIALLVSRNRDADAEAELAALIGARRRIQGSSHPDIAKTLYRLAELQHRRGRHEEAETSVREAIDLTRAAVGPAHQDLIEEEELLSAVLRSRDDPQGAIAALIRAREISEQSLGAKHPKSLGLRNLVAQLFASQGRDEEAEAEFRRALSIADELPPGAATTVSRLRLDFGVFLHQRQSHAEARNLMEAAWPILERKDVEPALRSRAAQHLAYVLWDAARGPSDQERARTLADEALATLERAGLDQSASASELSQWLQARGGRPSDSVAQ